MTWVWILGLLLVVAGAIYLSNRAAGSAPPRHRRYGTAHIRQMLDHRFGRSGGTCHEDVIRREGVPQINRNQKCPCGSGRKYKRCCGSTA